MISKKEEVLKFLQEIPKGKVSTYKILAEKFGTHPRAIAMFMKHNKYPETFPCYKIIKDNGELGWYSWWKWRETKIEKLEKDGIKIQNNKISSKYFYYGK